MPKPDAIADHLCELIAGLTTHRRGKGPHWIMVATVARELAKGGVTVTEAELQAAIALCVARHVLKAQGDPTTSISVWKKDWQI